MGGDQTRHVKLLTTVSRQVVKPGAARTAQIGALHSEKIFPGPQGRHVPQRVSPV